MEKNRESIERYLRGEMKEDELKNFTFQMVMNPGLRKEIEEVRTVFKTLRTQPEPKISFWKSRIFLSLLALVFVFGTYGVWNLISGSDNKSPDENMSIPIAEAGTFKSNEILDDLTLSVRSEGVEILQKPDLENFISKDSQFIFDLKIELSGNELLEKIRLSVWTNQQEDFENDNSILSKRLTVSDENTIEFREVLNISEGLYYYILANENDELINADKFILRYK